MTEEAFDLLAEPIDAPDPNDPKYHLARVELTDTLTELAEILDELPGTDLFTEAKVEPIKGGLRRTKELTGDAMKAYGDVTTGAGDVLHGSTKLSLKLIGLSAKLINFVCQMITKVPVTVTSMIDDLGRISGNALAGLTGKIQLYLPAESLDLFDKEIKGEIEHFIRVCEVFSAGDEWTTKLFADDFKRYRQLKQISNKLASIRYEPTIVNLKAEGVVDTYFNPKGEYYVRLKSLGDFFRSKKTDLEKLRSALQSKVAASENSGNFYKLSAANRLKAQDSVEMISRFMSVIGKYFRYVDQDLTTIHGQLVQLGKSAARSKLKSKGQHDGT